MKSCRALLLFLLLETASLSAVNGQIIQVSANADSRARRTEDVYEEDSQTVGVGVTGDTEEFSDGAVIFQQQFSDTQTINGIQIQVNVQVQIGVVTPDGGSPTPNPIRPPTPPPTTNPTPNPSRNPTRPPTPNPTPFPTPSPPCEKRSDACDNPNADGFQFCLGFNTDLNGRIDEFEKSAARWERIIDDFPDISGSSVAVFGPFDECTCGIPDVIDDVQICILEETLEDIVAFATPVIRSLSGSTILATLVMDPFFAIALDQFLFNEIMTEYVGILLQLITRNRSETVNVFNEYVGQEGLNVWQNDWGFGPNSSPPLVGNLWDSDCMPGEIMGSAFSDEPRLISELTVAALKDFNYPIRPNATAEVIDEDLILNRTNCPDPTNRRLGRSDDVDHFTRRRLENNNRVYQSDVPILDKVDLPIGFNDMERFNKIREKANERLMVNLEKAPKKVVVDDLEYVAHRSLVAAAFDDDGSIRFLMFNRD